MNQSSENPQKAVALIKFFNKKEHYSAFKNGSVLFRTPHFYRKNNDTGRGDRTESCFGYWDQRLGNEIPKILSNGSPINVSDAQSLLIYPTDEQQDSWLQSWSIIGPHNGFESSLERMLQEFGTYFVVLPAGKISAYAQLVSEASSSRVRYGLVRYSENRAQHSLTIKASKYSYQKEFRFFVGECSKDEVEDKPLHLNGVNEILLEASSLKFKSSSGEIKWCTLGHEKVANT